MKTTDFKPLPRPDFMEQSISGEPVTTGEQRHIAGKALAAFRRFFDKFRRHS